MVGANKGERIVGEAAGGSGVRAEMKHRLIERSLGDDVFRQQLLEDPRGTIEQELGTPVPEEIQIRAVAGGDPWDVQTYTDGYDRTCCS